MTTSTDLLLVATIAAQLERSPGLDRLRSLVPAFAAADADTITAILAEAATFSASYLAPLNRTADVEGCRLEEGRVRTATGHRDAWQAFVNAGWPTLDQPAHHGGQNLPLAVWAGCQEIFDRGCVAFGMLPGPQRAAAHLLQAWGDDAVKTEWLPRLVRGEWGATICISEPDAGSDVNRIRTTAHRDEEGMWRIQGEKIWISFGDHDLTPRIGHLLLAKASGPEGEEGISLFLVPDSIHTGINSFVRNSITIRRIEEKLGLHGSPTCALGFEGARGTLIGTPGRGLAQLFVMITNMRLSVGVQGLGVASGAADIALAYAEVRRQGGNAQRPPLRIAEHADIQRLLLGMVARVEVLRGLVLVTAIQADLAVHESDPAAASRARALAQWLLPIVKTTGGEFAFKVASDAIQVLGGAGYTREWPLEQALRDARVFTIYEGTTGMQALDLLHRRLWRDKGSGLEAFLQMARNDAAICPEPAGAALTQCLDLLERAAQRFAGLSDSIREAEAGATAFLKLASLAATAWIAVRLTVIVATDIASSRLRAAGLYWLTDVGERAVLANIQARRGAEDLCHFNDIRLNE